MIAMRYKLIQDAPNINQISARAPVRYTQRTFQNPKVILKGDD
jgi:hypothetical protein